MKNDKIQTYYFIIGEYEKINTIEITSKDKLTYFSMMKYDHKVVRNDETNMYEYFVDYTKKRIKKCSIQELMEEKMLTFKSMDECNKLLKVLNKELKKSKLNNL